MYYYNNLMLLSCISIVLLPTTSVLLNFIDSMRHDTRVTQQLNYNSKYPLSDPVKTPDGIKFRIAALANSDSTTENLMDNNISISYLQLGYMTYNSTSVKWDTDTKTLKTDDKRRLQLSELATYNGKLYTVDDNTGYVLEITPLNKLIRWVALEEGDRYLQKGFRTEWMTVKDKKLWVGGHYFLNTSREWVKSISSDGTVQQQNWAARFEELKASAGILKDTGYFMHNLISWSEYHHKWFFLPKTQISDLRNVAGNVSGAASNLLLKVSENFENYTLETLVSNCGFSSFKFIPSTNDIAFAALKTTEDLSKTETYITVMQIFGQVLLPETKVAKMKFVGVEFV